MFSFPVWLVGQFRGVLMSSLHGGFVTGFSAALSTSGRVGNGQDESEDSRLDGEEFRFIVIFRKCFSLFKL